MGPAATQEGEVAPPSPPVRERVSKWEQPTEVATTEKQPELPKQQKSEDVSENNESVKKLENNTANTTTDNMPTSEPPVPALTPVPAVTVPIVPVPEPNTTTAKQSDTPEAMPESAPAAAAAI